ARADLDDMPAPTLSFAARLAAMQQAQPQPGPPQAEAFAVAPPRAPVAPQAAPTPAAAQQPAPVPVATPEPALPSPATPSAARGIAPEHVITAIDTRARRLPPMPAPTPDPEAAVAEPAPPAHALSAVPQAPRAEAGVDELREELAAMRGMIEREMARMNDERLRGAPVRAQILDLLGDYGCEIELARSIAAQIPADIEPARAKGLMLGLLAKKLAIAEVDPAESGGVLALVGPTGAGKTTTLAKIAARYASRHGARDVALVTTDTVRVGGREQLAAYGRLLGMAVFEADSAESLSSLIERLADYRLVLVDTAGLSQRDRALMTRLAWLRGSQRVKSLLVLPANAHPADLDETLRRFRGIEPAGAVLTKVDETGRLGAALSVLVRHGLPLAYVADGQRVPEDLQTAEAHRIVLRLDALRRAADTQTETENAHVA
ncbi:flagellar biosynthesis protein FlhF, partial [Coralloluteibacterium stylophorae]